MNNITNNGISLSVNAKGRPVKIYSCESRFFIESREGTEYTIEIKNNNSHRVEAVVSVDGLSVISGKSASAKDLGYVINAWDSLSIKGYRKDSTTVGAFKFTKQQRSYATKKGKGENVGVIAVQIYKEKSYWTPLQYNINTITFGPSIPDYTTTQSYCGSTLSNAAINGINTITNCNNGVYITGSGTSHGTLRTANYCQVIPDKEVAEVAEFDHGTTWGQKIDDKVVTTIFERDYSIFTNFIYYNSKSQLELMGIKLVSEKLVALPKGFPADFATPPAGWQG